MTRKKKDILGQCQICGKHGSLTLEHVPNQAAYNKASVIEYSLEDELTSRKKTIQRITQGGIGGYTLCATCNNDTGHWYGDEYTRWASACLEFLKNVQPSSAQANEASIILHDVYPLRFLKQVIVCFFSVSTGLAQVCPELVPFVLDKYERHFPANCRFFMNFYFGPKPKLRRASLAGKISVQLQAGQIVPISGSVFSEITHPPFALVMSDEMGFEKSGEITSFSQYSYDQQVPNVTLRLQIIRGESVLPGSFT